MSTYKSVHPPKPSSPAYSTAQTLDLAWSRGAATTVYGIRMEPRLNPKHLDSASALLSGTH